jgi:hypothetical protein
MPASHPPPLVTFDGARNVVDASTPRINEKLDSLLHWCLSFTSGSLGLTASSSFPTSLRKKFHSKLNAHHKQCYPGFQGPQCLFGPQMHAEMDKH